MLHPLHIVLIPLTGALIGWLTNWAAIKMLFRPRRPVRLFGFQLQGLIPRRQHDLALRIADAIEQELFSHRDIRRAIMEPGFILDCERTIYEHIERFTEEKIALMPPVVKTVISGTVAPRFERTLADEIARRLPEILDAATESLEQNTSIRHIIASKIERFEVEKIEEIVRLVARKELSVIEFAGGAFGFTVGLIQVGLLVLFR